MNTKMIPWALEQTSKVSVGSVCKVVRGYNIPLGTIVTVDFMATSGWLTCKVYDSDGVMYTTYVMNLEVIAVPISWSDKLKKKAI